MTARQCDRRRHLLLANAAFVLVTEAGRAREGELFLCLRQRGFLRIVLLALQPGIRRKRLDNNCMLCELNKQYRDIEYDTLGFRVHWPSAYTDNMSTARVCLELEWATHLQP